MFTVGDRRRRKRSNKAQAADPEIGQNLPETWGRPKPLILMAMPGQAKRCACPRMFAEGLAITKWY